MSDALDALAFSLNALARLQAAAEDTRQRDLTRSLGQVECRGAHSWLYVAPCRFCKAEV